MLPAHLRVTTPPLWTGAVCVYPWSDGLARQFTVASKYEDDEPIKLWTEFSENGKNYIGLPWFCCPPSKDDRRSDGHPTQFKSLVKPRPGEQERCIPLVKEFLDAGQSGILKAPTGSGKTIMCADVIAHIGRTTMVVVPKDDLINQWLDRLCGTLPDDPNPQPAATTLKRSEIGRVQGDVCDFIGRPVVLGSLRSLCKPNRYPADLYRYFGLLVGDEVHNWGADQLGMIAHRFSARRRLGLSATVERKDGRSVNIYAHVGPVRVETTVMQLKPKVLRLTTNWKCPRTADGSRIPHKPGRIALVLKSILKNGPRNRDICRIVQMSFEKERRTVVFSDHIDHLELLEDLLPKYGIPPRSIGKYYGATKGGQLMAEGQKPVILATYQKMAEGTDIPSLDTLVFGSPRSNIEQALGRILRLHADKKPPVAFDFLDLDSPVLAAYAKSRLQVYARLGAEVVDGHLPEPVAA